jgi:hypothetical protein
VVNQHRGVINQFLGDGFMASFGAPLAAGGDQAQGAVPLGPVAVKGRLEPIKICRLA